MKAPDEVINSVIREMDIGANEIALRKSYLELTEDDATLLRDLHEQLSQARHHFIDDFYAHLMAFDKTRALIQDAPTLARLKQKQSEYFDSLTAGDYGPEYVRNRLRIGIVHQQIGLDPAWYRGAYSKYLTSLLPEVWHITQGDADQTLAVLRALIKIIFFDMGLAIDTYIHADRQAISAMKAFTENIIASLPLCLLTLSADLRIVSANLPCMALLGLGTEVPTGKHLEEILAGTGIKEMADQALTAGNPLCGMIVKVTCQQEQKILRVTITQFNAAEERKPGTARLLLIMENISEEERLRAAQAESAEQIRAIMDNVVDGIITIDERGIIKSFNRSAQRIFGYSADETISHNIKMLMPNPYHSEHDGYLERYAATHEATCLGLGIREVVGRRKDGATFPMSLATSEMRLNEQRLFIGVLRDITEQKQAQEHLDYLANYDALTGLPNRTLFQDRLSQALTHAGRHQQKMAMLFLDLDRFKVINDTLGHDCGDLLLRSVAQRLKGCAREEDTVARLGGDEFTIILRDIAGPENAMRVADKILEVFQQSFLIRDHELFITPSIGISLHPSDGDDAQTLLKNADTAMYRAKEKGKNAYQFYTADMNAKALAKLTLETHLRHALEHHEYLLHYQPMVDIASGQITSVEALIRWRHPHQTGLVPPLEFIPLLEDTGLIVPVGEWVLRTACTQAKAWQVIHSSPVCVSVNLSGRQFNDPNFAEQIGRILTETGLEPHLLELEITESMLMRNLETTIDTLNALHKMGIRLAIDDFGTGYSSLSYLRRFPIHTLKIASAFVNDVTTNEDDAAIATAIILLAHTLNLRVVAEGVETCEQLQFLHDQRCDMMQGYLFSKPQPNEALAEMLREGKQL